jgi:hypothetical protein
MKYKNTAACLALFATISIPVSASAQSAKPCLTVDQVSNVGVAILPSVINNLAIKCSSVLPADASLLQSGRSVAESYKERSMAARPGAYEAIKAVAGKDLPPEITADAVFPLAEGLIAAEMGKMKMAEVCPVANNMWAALKPLPLENWGEVLAVILLASANDAKPTGPKKSRSKSPMNDLQICPYMSVETDQMAEDKTIQ